MAIIMHVEGVYPKFGNDCFIAPNATIAGDVETGNDCSIWFNAVVRGDVNSIKPYAAIITGFHVAYNSCIGRYKTIVTKFWINTFYMHNDCHK